MHLECKKAHSIRINGHTIELAPGSRIHTENSYKFTVETFTRELSDAGFAPLSSRVDDEGLFSIHLAKAVCGPPVRGHGAM